MENFIPTKWHRFKSKNRIRSKVLHENVLYTVDKKMVRAWNFLTGVLIWKTKIKKVGIDNCLICNANGDVCLYVKTYLNQEIWVLSLVDGKVLSRNNIEELDPDDTNDDTEMICVWREYLVCNDLDGIVLLVDKSFKIVKRLYEYLCHIVFAIDENLALVNSVDSEVYIYNNSFELVEQIKFAENRPYDDIKYINGLFYADIFVYDENANGGEGQELNFINIFNRKGETVGMCGINGLVETFTVHHGYLFISVEDVVLVCHQDKFLGTIRCDLDEFITHNDQLYLFYRGGRVMRLGEYFPQHYARLTKSQHKQVDTWVSFRDQTKTVHKDISLLICRALLC